MPINIATIILLTRKESPKFSLKKNTPVVLPKILNRLMTKNRRNCTEIRPFLLRNAQFLPNEKDVTAPQEAPIDVAYT